MQQRQHPTRPGLRRLRPAEKQLIPHETGNPHRQQYTNPFPQLQQRIQPLDPGIQPSGIVPATPRRAHRYAPPRRCPDGISPDTPNPRKYNPEAR